MPGLVFKKSSTSAILVRMAQENPAGVTAGQDAGAAAADGELADTGDGCVEAGEVGWDLGIRLHPDSALTPSKLAATAAATTRMFWSRMFWGRSLRDRILSG
jgi:hypothetical protein